MASTATAKLAVLIDADNARPLIIEGLLAEIAKYGTAHVKRIYGDWTKPDLKGWKDALLAHSVQPVQQFGYTSGKNATDSAMIIDAMDLLYSERFDGFCIVSSDSDFTRLASRIREAGLIVYGFGERKTPKPFITACDKFTYTEVLVPATEHAPAGGTPPKDAKALRSDTALVNLLRNAVDAASDDTGWASLSAVGSIINKQSTDFDSRTWGYAKLSGLVKGIGLFGTEERQVGNGKAMYVALKPRP